MTWNLVLLALAIVAVIVVSVVLLTSKDKDEPDNFLRGGWCHCAYNNTPLFSELSNIIIAGGFQANSEIGPFCYKTQCNQERGNTQMQSFTTRWLAVGGKNVGIVDDQQTNLDSCLHEVSFHLDLYDGLTGIVFQMSGCVGDTAAKVQENLNWLQTQKDNFAIDSNIKAILVSPTGKFVTKTVYDKFDYVVATMHGDHDQYDLVDSIENLLFFGFDVIVNAYEDLVPKNRLFITYHTDALFHCGWDSNQTKGYPSGKEMLTAIATKARDEGYAGILGWPSIRVSPSADNAYNQPTTIEQQKERQLKAEQTIEAAIGRR